MKAWVSTAFLLFLPLTLEAKESLNLRYEDLPSLLQKNSLGVQAANKRAESARLRQGSVESSFLPKFGFEGGLRGQKEAKSEGESAVFWRVDAASNVYRGGKDQNRQMTRDTQVEMRKLDAQAFFQSERTKVRNDYIHLASVRSLLQVNQDMSQLIGEKRRSIAKKVQTGLLAESFALEVKLFDQELERDRLYWQKESHEIEDHLSFALSLPHELTIQVKSLAAIEIPKFADLGRVGDLPELKSLAVKAESSRRDSAIKADWWRPEVDVFASYTGLDVDRKAEPGILPEQETSIGLRFTLHLQDNAELSKEISAKMGEAQAMDIQREYLKNQVEHKVHEYQREIAALGSILQALTVHQKTAEDLQKKIVSDFDRGVRGSTDLLELMRKVYEIKKRSIEALKDLQMAKANLQNTLEI